MPPSQNKPASVRLTGRRVFLRRLQSADCAEFTALNQASVRSHRGWVAPPTDARTFADYLKRSQQPD